MVQHIERAAVKGRMNQEGMVLRSYVRIRLFILITKLIKDGNRQLGDKVESPLLEVRKTSVGNEVRVVRSDFEQCSSFDNLVFLIP